MASSRIINNTTEQDDLFSDPLQDIECCKKIPTEYGATCEAYLLTMYGKKHFMKRLKKEYRNNDEYKRIIRDEFLTCYPLNHPSLPRYLQAGPDYIIMDNIEGFTLNEFCENFPHWLSDSTNLRRFLKQLVSGMIYLHESDIIHNDLKPANVMMTKVCHNVKIVDFGFAYSLGSDRFKGYTKEYAAPELDLTKTNPQSTPLVDIYAFGVMMKEITKGHCVIPYYDQVFEQCCKQKPEDRPQSFESVAQGLGLHFDGWGC